MRLIEAKQILKSAGYLLKETRADLNDEGTFDVDLDATNLKINKDAILDALFDNTPNKQRRKVIADYFKELIGTDDVDVYNGTYLQEIINHMTYEHEGFRTEKGPIIDVKGTEYLIKTGRLYWMIKNDDDFSWNELKEMGVIKRI